MTSIEPLLEDECDEIIFPKKEDLIPDPKVFIQQHGHYLRYKSIDDFTIITLIQSNFFESNPEKKEQDNDSVANELILKKSNFITANLFKTLITLNTSKSIKRLKMKSLFNIKGTPFEHLSKCKFMTLNELAITNCLVESTDLEKYFRSSADTILKDLCKVTLKNIKIENNCLKAILENQKIQELDVVDCPNITDEAFPAKISCNLQTLHLEKLKLLENASLKKISEKQQLQKLVLIKIYGISDEYLNLILENLRSLQHLELTNLPEIKGEFLSHLRSKDLETFKFGGMKKLSNSNIRKFLGEIQILLPKLKSLEINDLDQINDDMMGTLANLQFNSLEELSFKKLLSISCVSIVKLFSCQLTDKVKSLKIKHCYDDKLSDKPKDKASLSRSKFTNIEKFSFKECTKLSKHILLELAKINNINMDKKIKILNLSGIESLDEAVASAFTKNEFFYNLEELYLEKCPKFTVRALKQITRSSMAKKLKILSLNHNPQLNDEIWIHLKNNDSKLDLLEDLRILGLNVSSSGIEQFLNSNKMNNIVTISLTDACIIFPSIYKSTNCKNLTKINGSWENLTVEELESLFKSNSLNKNFEFQNMLDKIYPDDSFINVLIESQFLKKIWELPQFDIRDINKPTLLKMLNSKDLNPCFNLDQFLKETKAMIDDEFLIAMANNRLCMKNLLHLDIAGAKMVTVKGIQAILNSEFMSHFFQMSEFLQKIQVSFGDKANEIVNLIPKGLKKLDLSNYNLENRLKDTLLLSKGDKQALLKITGDNSITLKALNLSRCNLTDTDLVDLGNSKLMTSLIILGLNSNHNITAEGFKFFFEIIQKKKIPLKQLLVNKCNITKEHLEILMNSQYFSEMKELSLDGCKELMQSGVPQLLELLNKFPNLNKKDIEKEFKNYIVKDKSKDQYKMREGIVSKTEELVKFLKNNEKKNEINKKITFKNKKEDQEEIRLRIRFDDKMIQDLNNNNKGFLKLTIIDFNYCAISSDFLHYIADNKKLKLQKLYLKNTNIDDSGILKICQSENMSKINFLDIRNCRYISQKSLEYITEAKFNPYEFNPDHIFSYYSRKIDDKILKKINSSENNFLNNMRKLDFTQSHFGLNEMKTCIEMEKINEKLSIALNLALIFETHKSEINDQILENLAESRLLNFCSNFGFVWGLYFR